MTKHRTTAEYQRGVDAFVRREVVQVVSGLVSTLAQANGGFDSVSGGSERGVAPLRDLSQQAAELCAPVLDYEEAARQEGWTIEGGLFVNHKTQTTATEASPSDACGWEDLCNETGLEAYAWGIFEHWIVSEHLAGELVARGERIDRDFAGMCVWGRTTTGQAISSDGVICDIWDALRAKVEG